MPRNAEPTAERLSQRRLNRAVLARQLLLERSSLPVERVLEQVAGLQTQYAPSGYIGLWSRMRDFQRPMLTRALETHRVIQATLMRATIHMVSAEDYWPMVHAVRRGRREWWLRQARSQLGDIDADRLAATVRQALSDGPLRQKELSERLEAAGLAGGMSGANMLVDLVRVPPSGTWDRRRADLYGLAGAWLPEPAFDEEAGIDHLVRRYLGGFGPATEREIATFAGLDLSQVRGSLERIEHRRFADRLVDLPDAPLPAEETPAPVRFIGQWEAILLVHARRTQVLPEAYRPRIFHTKAPQSFATVLVDGQVAGTWRHEPGGITLEPFAPLAPAARREVEAEAHRLEAYFTKTDGGGQQ